MADEPVPTIDYARSGKMLPPPNDAVGLPPREWLNGPARYAALLSVTLLLIAMIRACAFHSLTLARVVSLVMLVVAAADVVLVVKAVRALDYAGRAVATLAVCGVSLFAALVLALFALFTLLYPFGG